VPVLDARETALPAGVVIDATTAGSTNERSRLPVLPGSLYCDIMLQPDGTYVPTSVYSTPAVGSAMPFIHFWLTDASDVHPIGSVWTTQPVGVPFQLPMPEDALGPDPNAPGTLKAGGFYPPPPTTQGLVVPTPVLKGDRRLVTLYTKTGLVVTNTIESVPPLPPVPPNTISPIPGEGFHINIIDYPFLKAQQGQREAR